jgi:hypothetical protein
MKSKRKINMELELKCPECGSDVFHICRTIEEGTKIVIRPDKAWVLDSEAEVFDASDDIVKCGQGHDFILMITGEQVSDITELKAYLAEIEEEKNNPQWGNPFSLHYAYEINERAKETSKFLAKILDKMVIDIEALEITSHYIDDVMQPVALQVRALHCAGVGVGDTGTDEMIAGYAEQKLKPIFPDDYEGMGEDFYSLIHR